MRVVSAAEVYDQIEAEGAAYGLVPVMERGRCFVAQTQLQVESASVVSQVVEETVTICSVNMNAPLGNVWKSRKQRHEFNVADIYLAARRRREAAREAALLDRADQRARELERLGRRFGAGLVARAQLGQLNQAIRRQQGR